MSVTLHGDSYLSCWSSYYGYTGMGQVSHSHHELASEFLPCMHELSSLSFMHGAYLHQNPPPCILLVPCLVTWLSDLSTDLSKSCRASCKRIQLQSSAFPVCFTSTLQSGSSCFQLKYMRTCNLCEIFNCTHLKLQ